MIRYLIALGLLISVPSSSQAQGLSLPLPRKPDCRSYSDRDRVDRSGCTAVAKSKYARRRWNTPDSSALSKYKHSKIKYLTYHHQAFTPQCNDPAESYNKTKCARSGIDRRRTLNAINRRANSVGIRQQAANLQSSHIGRKTAMFAGGPDVKWGDIAYHFVVDRFGNIVEGRAIKYKPASGTIYGQGGKDRRFRYSTGTAGHFTVVILGNYDYEKPTVQGIRGIVRVLSAGQRRFRIPTENVAAHGDHANSSCPGKNLYAIKDKIKRMTIAYSVQSELRERGCKPGKLDGLFGSKSNAALNKLKIGHPSLSLTGADDDTLFELLNNPGKDC